MTTTPKLRIDKAHAIKLLRGETIAIRVPDGARIIRLHLEYLDGVPRDRNYIAEIMDTFFNGRPAR